MDHEVGDSRRVHRTSYGTQRVSATPRRAACHPFCIKFCSWPWRRAVGARVSLPCVCTGSPCVVRPRTGKQTPGGAGTHTGHTDRRTSQPSQPTTHPRETARRPGISGRLKYGRSPGADRSPRPSLRREAAPCEPDPAASCSTGGSRSAARPVEPARPVGRRAVAVRRGPAVARPRPRLPPPPTRLTPV